MNTKLKTLILAAALLGASAAAAQEPVESIAPGRHGNIAAAQSLSRQAYDRLTIAQQDNRYNLGGHAEKAKALLRQANAEMTLAAQAADQR